MRTTLKAVTLPSRIVARAENQPSCRSPAADLDLPGDVAGK
jgi:hypothetical protein